jgi:hypothetical protein
MAGLNHQVHGKLDLCIGCALPRAARFFQIIPIKDETSDFGQESDAYDRDRQDGPIRPLWPIVSGLE